MKNKLSLSVAILLTTLFSPYLFAATPLVQGDEQKDDQKEDTSSTQSNNQAQKPLAYHDTKSDKKILDEQTKKQLFKYIEENNQKMVEDFLDTYKDVESARNIHERTPFLFAAEEGHLQIAKLLKQRGVNVKAKSEWQNNALHFACLSSGSVPMVAWLLDVCKIGLEKKGNYQRTPFLCAAGAGQLAIAKLLRQRGANIKAEDQYRRNALHLACKGHSDKAETVKWLIEVCKLPMNAESKNKMTPFLWAVSWGNLRTVNLLQKKGVTVESQNKELMEKALNSARKKHCLYLVKYLKGDAIPQLPPSKELAKQLEEACKGDGNKLKNLLEANPNLDLNARISNGETLLHKACSYGNLDCVQLLVLNGADITVPTKQGKKALDFAKERNDEEEKEEKEEQKEENIKEFVVQYLANIQYWKTTSFLDAAKEDNLDMLRLLKAKGVDVKQKDEHNENALHKASEKGTSKTITFLIDKCKLSLETPGFLGMTPFLSAAYWHNIEAITVLLQRGANIKAKDQDGKTALYLAKYRVALAEEKEEQKDAILAKNQVIYLLKIFKVEEGVSTETTPTDPANILLGSGNQPLTQTRHTLIFTPLK